MYPCPNGSDHLSSLNKGAKVTYEEMSNGGKTSAENLRVG